MKKIYIASPFFNEEEREVLTRAENILRDRGFEVFSPREHEVEGEIAGSPAWSKKTFLIDLTGIDRADCLVLLYWGNYSDTGTAWECGYAYAEEKPVIIVHLGDSSNLMIHEGSHSNLYGVEELVSYDFETLPIVEYRGKMF